MQHLSHPQDEQAGKLFCFLFLFCFVVGVVVFFFFFEVTKICWWNSEASWARRRYLSCGSRLIILSARIFNMMLFCKTVWTTPTRGVFLFWRDSRALYYRAYVPDCLELWRKRFEWIALVLNLIFLFIVLISMINLQFWSGVVKIIGEFWKHWWYLWLWKNLEVESPEDSTVIPWKRRTAAILEGRVEKFMLEKWKWKWGSEEKIAAGLWRGRAQIWCFFFGAAKRRERERCKAVTRAKVIFHLWLHNCSRHGCNRRYRRYRSAGYPRWYRHQQHRVDSGLPILTLLQSLLQTAVTCHRFSRGYQEAASSSSFCQQHKSLVQQHSWKDHVISPPRAFPKGLCCRCFLPILPRLPTSPLGVLLHRQFVIFIILIARSPRALSKDQA